MQISAECASDDGQGGQGEQPSWLLSRNNIVDNVCDKPVVNVRRYQYVSKVNLNWPSK